MSTRLTITIVVIFLVGIGLLGWKLNWYTYEMLPPEDNSPKISEVPIVRECTEKADSWGMMSPRVDNDVAAEERFFLCLSEHSLNPVEYTYSGEPPSAEVLEFVKRILTFQEWKKKKEFLVVHVMDVSLTEALYLKSYYNATDVFTPSSEEISTTLSLFSNAINTGNYTDTYNVEKDASDYQVQLISMVVDGKKVVYAHAWSSGNFTVNNPFNPKKDFVTEMVEDGGSSYIDAVADLEKGTIVVQPHGDA